MLTRKMLICIFTGFSSGLPLYLLLNLLPAWLRSEGVDLKTIGFFALIQFPYTWKFLWAPLLDRYALPALGRRRGWMLLTQIGLLLSIGLLGGLSPRAEIGPVLWLAALLARRSGRPATVFGACAKVPGRQLSRRSDSSCNARSSSFPTPPASPRRR
ncbi:MAG: hypothetical protein J0H52_12605 [Comamonadaceae bacterium]|nr:hypothetical protein [Comamonadaceae bacterium]